MGSFVEDRSPEAMGKGQLCHLPAFSLPIQSERKKKKKAAFFCICHKRPPTDIKRNLYLEVQERKSKVFNHFPCALTSLYEPFWAEREQFVFIFWIYHLLILGFKAT